MSIYLLRSDNLVKIGFSDRLRTRFSSIVSSSPVPVEFVGHMPGGREVEAHLHKVFEASHFSGEWFVETPKMREMFSTLLIAGLPPIETRKSTKRTAEMEKLQALSKRIRETAKRRWPNHSVGERIDLLVGDLGWNPGRVRDSYYCHPRMALRAFEFEELERWFSAEKEEA